MDLERLRSELETMLTALSKTAAPHPAQRGDDAVVVAQSVMDEAADDDADALRTLSASLNEAVDDTGQVLAEHPFVAVTAAFLLGVAVGRISR
jgi:ElaB/YqjD/DUF883 family membrane-anchored ribosome-binding protein